jgi:hypothetical protein
MQVDIKKLQLGSDSAEKDIQVGLLDYFYQNPAYYSILNEKKTIIVGNRGVGKSAIFKYIASEETKKGTIVLELSPEEYSYEILSNILKKESDGSWGKQSSYSISWQYLLFNLIFKEIATKNKGFINGPLKNIYNYVRDNLKVRDINPIGVLISYLKRLEGIKVGKYEAKIAQTKELQSLYGLEEIQNLVPDLIKVLEKTKVKVLIDELDKGWDNSEDSRYFVAGLFQAAQKMNSISNNLRVYVSIRQELFDNIPQIYDDAQKIREDIEVIRWSEDELLEFINLRILNSFPQTKDMSSSDRWNLIFSEVLNYRNTKSYNYIIDRTQLRPRELLQFCKLCVENHNTQETINYSSITSAEMDYSEQKIKDLASEYRFQYPHLLDIFEIFRGRKYTLDKDDLEYLLLTIVSQDVDVGNATWVVGIDYLELKKILWQIGFLKAWMQGGLKSVRRSGSAYLGYYEISKINLENIKKFQVHSALGLI